MIAETVAIELAFKGKLDIQHNLDVFKQSVEDGLATINRKPVTDEELGEAEETAKALKDLQGRVVDARNQAVKENTELSSVMATLDKLTDDIRECRLDLERAVKASKDRKKKDAIERAIEHFAEKADISKQRAEMIRSKLQDAIKGKRSVKSVQDACDQVVGVRVAEVNECNRILLEWVDGHPERGALIPDQIDLSFSNPKELPTELEHRLAQERLRQEKLAAESEAAKAMADKQAAEDALKEKDKPPLPPEGDGSQADEPPSENGVVGPATELVLFKEMLVRTFRPLKEAREKLRHDENRVKVQAFSEQVNAAYKALK